MLTTQQIKTRAVQEHTSGTNIAREYCQHLFLSALYRQPASSKLYFKGGTALRLLYRSPRFSEDLDFDSPDKNIANLEALIIAALSHIEATGVDTELTEAKTTSGGYLATATLKLTDFSIMNKIEISLRNGTTSGEVTTVENDYLPTYPLVQLREDQLMTSKLNALLNRRKPRDFYDLYFMLRARLITPKQRRLLPQVLTALVEAKPRFEAELKAFLPQSHWIIIKDLPKALEREIKRFI
ncbi:MAG: nucleotidyl transferase AbiEii/AbiGii toxin family protein [bacterium]|nr:nucleotidyl transferase AbiEii/AbiGii toxin family protein [bacterium]MDZ4341978.1 nucleotidyl transferase AbiEii/AbiGii toxin family protein [Candidatus Binatia bacterium]